MQKNHGQIIELAVRKKNFSITELARCAQVNRSVVYQWFNKKDLDADVVYRIGRVLDHDFSDDFPEYFEEKKNDNVYKLQSAVTPEDNDSAESWKDKYLALLEKYVQLLSEMTES